MVSAPKALRPLTALIVGPRMWYGCLGLSMLVWAAIHFGARLHMQHMHMGTSPNTDYVAIALLLGAPAMVAKVVGDLDLELSWRPMGALLPGRERRFAKACWVLAAWSVLVTAVIFQCTWGANHYLQDDLGGAPSWGASLSMAALGFVSGLWFRRRAVRGAKYLWQFPTLILLGYSARPLCIVATRQPWIAGLVWALAFAALLLRTRPKPALLERTNRGLAVLGTTAGEELYLGDLPDEKISTEAPPEITGRTHQGWIRAQRFALRTTVSGLGSLKFVGFAAFFFLAVHTGILLVSFALGHTSNLRTELVLSLLGVPGSGVEGGLVPFEWLDVTFATPALMCAVPASAPMFGAYFYPMTRSQRGRLVFHNTVYFGLISLCALVLVSCGVGYSARALGEIIEVASVPAALRVGLLMFAIFPVFVAMVLGGLQVLTKPSNQKWAVALYVPMGCLLLQVVRRGVNSSHVLDLDRLSLSLVYLATIGLIYGAFFWFVQCHFRRADLQIGSGQ